MKQVNWDGFQEIKDIVVEIEDNLTYYQGEVKRGEIKEAKESEQIIEDKVEELRMIAEAWYFMEEKK